MKRIWSLRENFREIEKRKNRKLMIASILTSAIMYYLAGSSVDIHWRLALIFGFVGTVALCYAIGRFLNAD